MVFSLSYTFLNRFNSTVPSETIYSINSIQALQSHRAENLDNTGLHNNINSHRSKNMKASKT